jgi:signal transduction histidine kinase
MDSLVAVHIHNTGPGIPPDELPSIFEMYETTGTAPYSQRHGVGLGLYLARLLIEAHGGTIWAESQPGEGATFSFTLPLAKPEKAGA